MAIYKDGRLSDRAAIEAGRRHCRPPRFLVDGIASAFDGTTEAERVELRQVPIPDYERQSRYAQRQRLRKLFAKVAANER